MRTLVPAIVALLLLTGCTSPSTPNEVDAARLDALAAEPLLIGGAETEASTTLRANVAIAHDWSFGGGSEVWELTTELVTELRLDGWLVTQQNCEASEEAGLQSAQLVAVKDLDGFTAAMLVRANEDGAKLRAFAPFHDEDSNPWKAQAELVDGCLDGDEPVTAARSDLSTDVDQYYGEH